MWYESDVACAQDPSLPVRFIGYQILWTDKAHFQYRSMINISLFANFEVRSSLRSDAIVITTDGRTDRHSSKVLEFRADQMSPRYLGSQINISMRPTLIDETNIPSMRRV